MANPSNNGTGAAASKSDTYNKAVARATGTDGGGAMKPIPSVSAMITDFKPEDVATLAMSGDFEFAPQNVKLEPGSAIEGILEGRGPDAEFGGDNEKDEIRVVNTWIIVSPDGSQRAALLGSSQLDRKLPPFVGGFVKIFRGKDIALAGGHRVADYLVGGHKLADGKTRTFVQVPKKMIEVESAPTAPQLTAGDAPAATPTATA